MNKHTQYRSYCKAESHQFGTFTARSPRTMPNFSRPKTTRLAARSQSAAGHLANPWSEGRLAATNDYDTD